MLTKTVPCTARLVHLHTPALLQLLLALYATSTAETTYPSLHSHCLAVNHTHHVAERVCLIAQVCEVEKILASIVLMMAAVDARRNIVDHIDSHALDLLRHAQTLVCMGC